MSLFKKSLLGLAIAIGIICLLWFPLALGLMAGFPFAASADDKVERVGARATFKESADCLIQYEAERNPFGVSELHSKNVSFCFPPQTAAKKKELIACFNRYGRIVGSYEWPKDNMRACRWDGLPAVSSPFAFGKVEAVPAVPRAGKRFVLKVGMTSSDSASRQPADISGAVGINVWLNADTQLAYEFLNNWESEVPADGKLHVSLMVPKTAEGMQLAIKFFLKPDAPGSTKLVAYTVKP